jgi:type VI secretion system protein ImpH
MAASTGLQGDRLALLERLQQAPWEFDFFQALRRLECLHPERPRLGKGLRPAEEPVRLAQETSMAFAPSTLASCAPQPDGLPARLAQRFFGLLGPNGALPLHLTEHALERSLHHGDRTFARFLDLFHHRMLLLFYRAWADAQPAVWADRPQQDRFAFYLGALSGRSTAHLIQRDAVPDAAKLHFTGHLARQVRNAEGLESMLSDYFRLPVKIEQFVTNWLSLPADQRTRLGGWARQSIALGRGAVLGKRACDVQSKFRIRLGPLHAEDYAAFLPGQPRLQALRDWVRNWVGFELDWDVTLVLAREEVSGVRLGRDGRLGWSSWLGAWRKQDHADDLVLRPERAVAAA